MKILMMTNTYAPMVGGIEESIRSFTEELEKLGHGIVIVAPECEGVPPDEINVIRLRAIQRFNNSEFSIALPMSGLLKELTKQFDPDIIHCHHPFWMGDIALRLSSQFRIPLVFTYHTMFEHHMHYLPVRNEGTKRFIIELFAGFANLATQVIAPSESVRAILVERGVDTPIDIIPTGVNLGKFSKGAGSVLRGRMGIPMDHVVIGHVGRLALEKNIAFLARSVARYLKKDPKVHFLVGGDGPLKEKIQEIFKEQGVKERLHLAGVLKGQDLVDCYHAMDLFAFASLSETQGIVLVEAMAAGVPVVAVDAPGVREVVKDGYNGRLIFKEDEAQYGQALAWCFERPEQEFKKMKENALKTTEEFSASHCAEKLVKTFQKVMVNEFSSPDYKNSPWGSLADRLRNEWDMFKNMMLSGRAAITDSHSILKPERVKTKRPFQQMSHLLSMHEWSAKILHLPLIDEEEAEPGIILVQIDGFSRLQLKKSMAENNMPFLNGLFKEEFYQLYSQYPGLPSSTPSVQGELFYGVKQAVPAFAFLDRECGKIFRMYDSKAVMEIERRLTKQGRGLLEGGSSYSNIYSGGAAESHFCAASLGWDKIWKEVNPFSFVLLAATQFPSFVRMFVLTAWEILLGVVEFGRSILKGESLKKELKFIYLRALICVLLRELVVVGTKIDMARGLPIIHLNLLGYDELSHNHGPSSKSAHWSLKGIDRSIEKIYRAAIHSPRRNYDVWIYSDHGQEDTDSYVTQYGRTVQEAVAEVYKKFDEEFEYYQAVNKKGEQIERARFLGFSFIGKLIGDAGAGPGLSIKKKLIVTAIGPTGNIYLPRKMEETKKYQFARECVESARIPVMLLAEAPDQVRVFNSDGDFTLPKDAKVILGEDHPFLEQVTEDLIHLCHHPNAGDFTFLGYRPGQKRITFPLERGSHAGPGPEETEGFALLPSDINPRQRGRSYITPMDIRLAALRFLKRSPVTKKERSHEFSYAVKSESAPDTIRLMTYNVHACIGMDGKISPERIARVIRRHKPDIVALQELDRGRKRTGRANQPKLIAQALEMHYHFYPSLSIDNEQYGNAVFSRYPMELMRVGQLPDTLKNSKAEPRGALWTVINIAGIKINFFNTHLSPFPSERTHQSQALLGKEWINHPACQGPVILCGDFNALPDSQLCRKINKTLRDAQAEQHDHRPEATWFSHYPVKRIDHVFISEHIDVVHTKVSGTRLDKLASDHLPLIVDIKFKPSLGFLDDIKPEIPAAIPQYN